MSLLKNALVILHFIPVVVFSQISFNYGIQAGPVFSNQNWEYANFGKLSFDNLLSYTIRTYAELTFLTVVSLQGEIGLTQKGFVDNLPETNPEQPDGTGKVLSISNKFTYMHLGLPVKFNYSTSVCNLYFAAGPQLLLMTGNHIHPGYKLVTDKYKESLFGFSTGAGIEFSHLLPVVITAGYRYESDLTKVYKTQGLSINNYSHTILVGFRF